MKWLLAIGAFISPWYLCGMNSAISKDKDTKFTTYIVAKIKYPAAEIPDYTIESTDIIPVSESTKKEKLRELIIKKYGWRPEEIKSSNGLCLLWWYPENKPHDISSIVYSNSSSSPCSMNMLKPDRSISL